MAMNEQIAYREMLAEAKDRVLFVSPPYADKRKRDAFLAGYEAALSDIARGHLMPRAPGR